MTRPRRHAPPGHPASNFRLPQATLALLDHLRVHLGLRSRTHTIEMALDRLWGCSAPVPLTADPGPPRRAVNYLLCPFSRNQMGDLLDRYPGTTRTAIVITAIAHLAALHRTPAPPLPRPCR